MGFNFINFRIIVEGEKLKKSRPFVSVQKSFGIIKLATAIKRYPVGNPDNFTQDILRDGISDSHLSIYYYILRQVPRRRKTIYIVDNNWFKKAKRTI